MKSEIIDRLKAEGYRMTKTRQSLIGFILNRKGHWTVHDLLEELQPKIPKMGVATLYRTVSLLYKLHYLSETRLGGGAARYEVASRRHHDHLTCASCGEVFEFENERIELLQKQMARKLSFKLIDHRMELFGECLRQPCPYKKRHPVKYR